MKFLVDRMLGRLAKGLRMLGYDTVYYRGTEPDPMIQLARREGRVILTRNTKLTPKRPEDRIFMVTKDVSFLQLRELVEKGLVRWDEEEHFSRCLLCNALLSEIPRNEADGKVPDFTFSQQRQFFQCPQCKRIYWQGSHQENMRKRIAELRILDGQLKPSEF